MKYRNFGKIGWKPSALGFGAMRLPIIGEDPAKVDHDEAVRMMRTAIDKGVNYIDTAYPYHGGTSEVVVGKALKEGYRERVKIATKLPCWVVEKGKDLDRIFEEQMKRLDVQSIDFYLFHNLNVPNWSTMLKLDALAWAEKKMAEGLIGHLGFSFHDELPQFREVVDGYDNWEFCQIQYNYMDMEYQAGKEGLDYAAGKGLGVIVMEPLKGGQLALNPPPGPVGELWNSTGKERSPAAWALNWLWNQPEVSLLLSGMSTMDQVLENIEIADNSGTGILEGEDLRIFDRVADKFRSLRPVACTKCNYCLPCPEGVGIPRVLELYNETQMYSMPDAARAAYRWFPPEKKGDKCIECGECEEKCPQNIEIIRWLKKAQEILS